MIKEGPVLVKKIDRPVVNKGIGTLESTLFSKGQIAIVLAISAIGLLSNPVLHADNGLAAFASPLEGLQVDGDLSDWPASIDRQSVRSVQHFDYPTGPEDGYVFFQVGYNLDEGAIYVGFEIYDDSRSVVVDASPEFQDRIGLFLDLNPLAVPSSSRSSLNFYFHLRYDFAGWMDRIRNGWTELDGVASIAQERGDEKWIIELKIDVAALTDGGAELRSSANLGIDVGFYDVDLDLTVSEYLWGNGIGKYENISYGDLFLLGENERLVPFIGQIQSPISTVELCRDFFYLESTEHPDWPALMIVGDGQNRFQSRLPEGRYRVPSSKKEIIDLGNSISASTSEYSIELVDERRSLVPLRSSTPTIVQAPDWEQDGQWFSANLRELFPGIIVTAIAVDKAGELWIASNLGVIHYDGFQYVHYNPVVDGGLGTDLKLVFDSNGRLWVVDYLNGMFVFEEGQFYKFELGPGVFDYLDCAFAADDGSVWFSGQLGVFRFFEGRFQIVGSHENYRFAGAKSVAITSQGSLWVAGASNRLHRYYKDQLVEVPEWEQDRSEPRKSLGSIAVDRDNSLFLNALGGLIIRFDDGPQVGDIRREVMGEIGESIGKLAIDQRGGVWAGGGSAYRVVGGRDVFSAAESGLLFSSVEGIVPATDGTVWICSKYDGLARYRNSNVEEIILPDKCEPYTAGLELGVDHFIFGTGNDGLVEIYDGLVHEINMSSTAGALLSNSVTRLEKDASGGIWVGTPLGVCYRDNERTWHSWIQDSNRPIGEVYGLEISREGDVWVAAREGLCHYENESWEKLPLASANGEIVHGGVFDLEMDSQDRLWVLTTSGVLTLSEGRWGDWFDLRGLISGTPREICIGGEEKALWFGTSASGVYRFEGNLSEKLFEQISVDQGLADIGVTCLLLDSRQRLWAGTKNGLSQIDGNLLASLGMRDGLPGSRVTDLDELSEGVILVTTDSGAVIYTPQNEEPKIAVEVMDSGSSGEDSLIPSFSSENQIEIGLRGYSDSTAPQQMRFLYRLGGDDSAWIVAEKGPLAFESLSPGEYQFEAKAVDRDLVISSEPAQLTFVVVYPYRIWIQWVAWIGLGGGALFAGGLAWVRNRQRNQSRAALVQQTLNHNRSLVRANNDAEEARRHAEKASQAKSEFLANISHEIRTPMNAIVGFSRFFSDPGLPTEKRIELAESVERSSRHLLGLVNDVLDFSKIEAGKVELDFDVFDLSALIAELDKTFGARCVNEALDWRVSFDFGTPYYVRGDQKHLRQILMNLIGNAVKFTETGFVSLTVTREIGQELVDNEAVPRIKFEVADSGVGIGVEDQKAMFDLFEQGQQGKEKGGTGLGLGIAIRLADLMEGEIRVESELGKGATFILSLPLAVETVSPIKSSGRVHDSLEVCHGGNARQVKALVVDDVADNRLLLRMLLERKDVNVEEASNGQAGMELVAEWGPDIVFMDLRMPGMSGNDFLKQHRKDPIHGSLPVIAVTASAFQHERDACLERGFDDFLSKPIEVDELEQVFKKFIHLGAGDLSDSDTKNSGLEFAQLDVETSQQLRLLIGQYRRTELKETLQLLKEGDGPNQALATHCLALVSAGNWEGLAEIVDRLSVSP